MPGSYKETVYIDKDNITLSGVVEQGKYPVLEGEVMRNDAVLYSGTGVTVENLYITHCKGSGVMGQAGNNYIFRNNFVVDNNHENFAIPGSLVSTIPQGTGVLIMACDDVVIENNIISANDSVGISPLPTSALPAAPPPTPIQSPIPIALKFSTISCAITGKIRPRSYEPRSLRCLRPVAPIL
jgi:hypothetical protein